MHSSINQCTQADCPSVLIINRATKHYLGWTELSMVFKSPLSLFYLSKLTPNLRLATVAADESTTSVRATTLRDPVNKQQRRIAIVFSLLLRKAGAGLLSEDARPLDSNKMGGFTRHVGVNRWRAPSVRSRLAKATSRGRHRVAHTVHFSQYFASGELFCPGKVLVPHVHGSHPDCTFIFCLVVPLTSLGPFFLFPSLFLLF